MSTCMKTCLCLTPEKTLHKICCSFLYNCVLSLKGDSECKVDSLHVQETDSEQQSLCPATSSKHQSNTFTLGLTGGEEPQL